MVTYNQERWVPDAIESVRSQDLEDWEIVVGDDGSTDGTLEIVRAIAAEEDRIRILDTPEKLGPRANYIRTLNACRGEYVNQLDGDDVFLSASKLSHQVALVASDSSLIGAFCPAAKIDESGVEFDEPRRPHRPAERFGLVDFAEVCLADSSTVLFRRQPDRVFPDWFNTIPMGDWPLHMLNLRQGDYAYTDEVLAGYRIHGGGVWSKLTEEKQRWRILECQRVFLEELAPERAKEMAPGMVKRAYSIARNLAREGNTPQARRVLKWVAEHAPGAVPANRALETKAVVYWRSVGELFGKRSPVLEESEVR